MTTLTEAGLGVTPGHGTQDSYTLVLEGRATSCYHRAADATVGLDVDCAGRIEHGQPRVHVRHGWRLAVPVHLECLLAAGVLYELHPCGHGDVTRGCGGCDPGAVEFVVDDDNPGVLRAPRPDDFTGGAR